MREKTESIVIEDAQDDPRWQTSSTDLDASILIVPILGRFNLIGILILTHEQKGYFSTEHLVLTQAIASQAGIALENCRLYTDLSNEQQRISAVLNSASDGILMFDGDGCLSITNPTANLLFTGCALKPGLPLARGQGFDSLIEIIETALDSAQAHRAEIVWPDQRVFSADVTPLENGGCVILLHDVSHFKDLERVKDEFIATASHDLRNPLASVKGYSHMVMQAGGLSELQMDFVHRIQHATGHMEELIEDLLDLTKMDLNEENKFETLDIVPILAETADEFNPLAEAKGQTIRLEEMKGRFKVRGDSLKLRQAFRNLVGNAVKYTPTDGKIQISADVEEDTLRLRVRDTGYGIPAADLPHIFDRFYRVRTTETKDIEGSGLGLAIVKSIVERHGGNVSVESGLGKGSCFTVSLPRT
jgi:two-component system phosphate regulon sensor histidine kinase PhoR